MGSKSSATYLPRLHGSAGSFYTLSGNATWESQLTDAHFQVDIADANGSLGTLPANSVITAARLLQLLYQAYSS